MERIDKNKKPLWKKTTPGTLIIRTPIFLRTKPKQEVRATKEELGRYWESDFELVEKGKGKFKVKKEKDTPEDTPEGEANKEFTVEHVGSGWYNVLSPTGKVMNESKLRSADAEKLKSELEPSSE